IGRVPVQVRLVEPQRLLAEVVVQALVRRTTVVVAAASDTHTSVDLRVDLAVDADTRTHTLTALVAGVTVRIHIFVTHAHVTFDLCLGGPSYFFLKRAEL